MTDLAQQVDDIIKFCLFTEEEIENGEEVLDNIILVEAVDLKIGFHTSRLEEKRENIRNILNKMPKEFHIDTGGGWSFLKMFVDIDGNSWGKFFDADALVALGLATGMISFYLDKEFWSMLSNGMPYVIIDTKKGEPCETD